MVEAINLCGSSTVNKVLLASLSEENCQNKIENKNLNEINEIKSFYITEPSWIPMDGLVYRNHLDYLSKIVKKIPKQNLDNIFSRNRIDKNIQSLVENIDNAYSSYTSFYFIEFEGDPRSLITRMNFNVTDETNIFLKENEIFEVLSSAISIEEYEIAL